MANDNVIPPGMTRAQYLNSLDVRSPTFENDFTKVLKGYQKELDDIIPDTLKYINRNKDGGDTGTTTATGGSQGTSGTQTAWEAESNALIANAKALCAADRANDALNALQQSGGPGCCCPGEPDPTESGHPEGSLTADDKGVITTPGGYKIEATAQFNWKITGPDGKKTEIWGDPHVKEGDGGNWDFKRNSTFVLADGTRINVNVKPYGNGMTVTDKLEVIAGNQRAEVTGIGEGKGKTGQITNDGYAHVNTFGGNDAFVMGKETDDWSFQGKEITGSNGGGDSFKLGNDLPAGVVKPVVDHAEAQGTGFFNKMYEALSKIADSLEKAMLAGNKNFQPPNTDLQKLLGSADCCCCRNKDGSKNADALKAMGNLFTAVGKMFEALSELVKLTNQVRRPPTYQTA